MKSDVIEIRLRKTPTGYRIIEGRSGLLEALRARNTVPVNAGEFGEFEVVNLTPSDLTLRQGGNQWTLEGLRVVGVLSELH